MLRTVLIFFVLSALPLAGCGSTQAVSASKDKQTVTARAVIGNALVGTKGKTPRDQDNIDRTVARLCGAEVWTKAECARHDTESRS